MKLIKVVILWVFTVAALSLIGVAVVNSLTTMREDASGPYVLYILIAITSAVFIAGVGGAMNWKGFKEKRKSFE